MHPNAERGEIVATFSGRRYRLCLTLGALAELESALGADDLLALAARLEGGRLSAREVMAIIAAGLRGAGHDVDDAAVARLTHAEGVAGFAAVVARLLCAAFPASGGTASPPEAAARTAETAA